MSKILLYQDTDLQRFIEQTTPYFSGNLLAEIENMRKPDSLPAILQYIYCRDNVGELVFRYFYTYPSDFVKGKLFI